MGENTAELQELLSMAILDLEESKKASASAWEENKVLLKEKELLREKLNIHLDMWAMDKRELEEDLKLSKRQYDDKISLQDYEKAKLNLLLGFYQQESLQLKLKLEFAVDDVEDLHLRIQFLNAQLQESEANLYDAKRQCSVKEAQMTQKTVEADRSIHELQALLPEWVRKSENLERSLLEVKEKHALELAKLKKERLLSSKRDCEMSGLVRERNFVWDQLKRMEEDYVHRLKTKEESLRAAENCIRELQSKVEEVQKAHSEKAVEMAILKVTAEEAEHEVCTLKEKLMMLIKENAALDEKHLVSQIDNSSDVLGNKKALESSYLSSEGIEVAHKCQIRSQGERNSQKELETAVSLEEFKKTLKQMDGLRFENQNLKALNAQLQGQMKEMRQKPKKANRKPVIVPTARNLNVELDEALEETLGPCQAIAGNSRKKLKPTKLKVVENDDGSGSSSLTERIALGSLSPNLISASEEKYGLRTRGNDTKAKIQVGNSSFQSSERKSSLFKQKSSLFSSVFSIPSVKKAALIS